MGCGSSTPAGTEGKLKVDTGKNAVQANKHNKSQLPLPHIQDKDTPASAHHADRGLLDAAG